VTASLLSYWFHDLSQSVDILAGKLGQTMMKPSLGNAVNDMNERIISWSLANLNDNKRIKKPKTNTQYGKNRVSPG